VKIRLPKKWSHAEAISKHLSSFALGGEECYRLPEGKLCTYVCSILDIFHTTFKLLTTAFCVELCYSTCIYIVEFVINNSHKLILSTQNGETPLQVAAFYGYNNLVEKLIQHKSYINRQDKVSLEHYIHICITC